MKKINYLILVFVLTTITVNADLSCIFSNDPACFFGRRNSRPIRQMNGGSPTTIANLVNSEKIDTASQINFASPGLKNYLDSFNFVPDSSKRNIQSAIEKLGFGKFTKPLPEVLLPLNTFESPIPNNNSLSSTLPNVYESQSTAKEMQSFLNSQGAKLEVDGDWGPRSITALKEFQGRKGLPKSGILDGATLEKMDEVGDKQLKNKASKDLGKSVAEYAQQELFDCDTKANSKTGIRGDGKGNTIGTNLRATTFSSERNGERELEGTEGDPRGACGTGKPNFQTFYTKKGQNDLEKNKKTAS